LQATSWRMQIGSDSANDETRFAIATIARHSGERSLADDTFQEQSIVVMGKHACRSLPSPPDHQNAAVALLRLAGDFQHRGHAIAAYQHQVAAVSADGRAIRHEVPSAKIGIEHEILAISWACGAVDHDQLTR